MPESNEPVAQAPVDPSQTVSQPAADAAVPPGDPAPTVTVSEPTGAQDAPVPGPTAVPVVVDLKTRRSDDDPILGSWVDVVSGQHAARSGYYAETVDNDPTTGYPRRVLVRTRDARNELLEVEYSDLRPSERTGGR